MTVKVQILGFLVRPLFRELRTILIIGPGYPFVQLTKFQTLLLN